MTMTTADTAANDDDASDDDDDASDDDDNDASDDDDADDDDVTGDDDDDATETATENIGSGGGTIRVGSASIAIPPDALSGEIAITMSKRCENPLALPGALEAASDCWSFTPHGTAFAKPVSVTIPLLAGATDATVGVASRGDENDPAWSVSSEQVEVEDGAATFEVTSFSQYLLVRDGASDDDDDDDDMVDDDDDDNADDDDDVVDDDDDVTGDDDDSSGDDDDATGDDDDDTDPAEAACEPTELIFPFGETLPKQITVKLYNDAGDLICNPLGGFSDVPGVVFDVFSQSGPHAFSVNDPFVVESCSAGDLEGTPDAFGCGNIPDLTSVDVVLRDTATGTRYRFTFMIDGDVEGECVLFIETVSEHPADE